MSLSAAILVVCHRFRADAQAGMRLRHGGYLGSGSHRSSAEASAPASCFSTLPLYSLHPSRVLLAYRTLCSWPQHNPKTQPSRFDSAVDSTRDVHPRGPKHLNKSKDPRMTTGTPSATLVAGFDNTEARAYRLGHPIPHCSSLRHVRSPKQGAFARSATGKPHPPFAQGRKTSYKPPIRDRQGRRI